MNMYYYTNNEKEFHNCNMYFDSKQYVEFTELQWDMWPNCFIECMVNKHTYLSSEGRLHVSL